MEKEVPAVALVVAGSDASGRSGMQADLRVFGAFGVHGVCALSAVTSQPEEGTFRSWQVPSKALETQLRVALTDHQVGAIKVGMLGDADAVRTLGLVLSGHPDTPLVLDPVLATSSGSPLLSAAGRDALKSELLPRTSVLTPNLLEAALLCGDPDPERAVDWTRRQRQERAEFLLELGPRAVYLKGGHGSADSMEDLLVTAEAAHWFPRERFETSHLRGTGCLLSAAICSGLALGNQLEAACVQAGAFVSVAISQARAVGRGAGCPVVPSCWPPSVDDMMSP